MQKLHQVLQPKVTKPARSTKPLTLPDDIELQTTRRCEGRPGSAQQQPVRLQSCDEAASARLVNMFQQNELRYLRYGPNATCVCVLGCMQERSPFKPLAERVREFQYKTPPRFKSRPSRAASNKKKSPITRAEVSHTHCPDLALTGGCHAPFHADTAPKTLGNVCVAVAVLL